MASNSIEISAPPEAVFAVLESPHTYPEWLVGCKDIRAVDPAWPASGTCFHHSVGWGPLEIRDLTRIVETDGKSRLLLEARARPVGTALVRFELHRHPVGTLLKMDERPLDRWSRLMWTPVHDFFVARRNDRSLRQLKDLVEAEWSEPEAEAS